MSFATIIFLVVRMLQTGSEVDPRPATGQADFTRALLSQAPNGAILVTQGDADSFPLWYAHYGLKQRPDVRVVVQPLTQFRWYQETLHHTYPDLLTPVFAERSDGGWADQLLALNPAWPVCRTFEDSQAPAQVGFTCQEAP